MEVWKLSARVEAPDKTLSAGRLSQLWAIIDFTVSADKLLHVCVSVCVQTQRWI